MGNAPMSAGGFFVRASIAVHKELLEGPEGRLKDMFSTRCMESVGGASLHSQCREIRCVAQHTCHKRHKQVAKDGGKVAEDGAKQPRQRDIAAA